MKTRSSSTKIRTDINCPTCGMSLTGRNTVGFTKDSETFCCEGCATGAECSCDEPVAKIPKIYNRPGSRGQRNVDNSAHSANGDAEATSSGKAGKQKSTAKSAGAMPSRGQLNSTGEKRPKPETKQLVPNVNQRAAAASSAGN